MCSLGVESGGQSSDSWNFFLGFTVKNIGMEPAGLDWSPGVANYKLGDWASPHEAQFSQTEKQFRTLSGPLLWTSAREQWLFQI